MPSLAHRVAAAYIRLRRHRPGTADVADAARRARFQRRRERPEPPGALRRGAEGLLHIYLLMPIPEAKPALRRIDEWISGRAHEPG